MLSTGNHGELIIDGWLASSDENASPVRSVVPATSNRTGCGCVGNRHVSHTPTAYIGMKMKIHTKPTSDGP